MNTRRDFLRLSALVPLVAIPWTLVPDNAIKPAPNKSKIRLQRFLKYMDYTLQDWKDCKFIIFDDRGRRLWAPPITYVRHIVEPFSVELKATHRGIRPNLKIVSSQFVDLDGHMPFGRTYFDKYILTSGGEDVTFTHRLSMS